MATPMLALISPIYHRGMTAEDDKPPSYPAIIAPPDYRRRH